MQADVDVRQIDLAQRLQLRDVAAAELADVAADQVHRQRVAAVIDGQAFEQLVIRLFHLASPQQLHAGLDREAFDV